MDAGARGVEIIVSGKVTSQRARTQIFRAGTMSKSGQPAQEGVDKGVAQCVMKSGTLGIIVKIMSADYRMGDGVVINYDALSAFQQKINSKKRKTKIEELLAKKELEITETEGTLTEEDKELLDEVNEDDVSEISLEPKKEEIPEEKKEEEGEPEEK